MGWKRSVSRAINAVLSPLGARIVPSDTYDNSWDRTFRKWVIEARAQGRDVNDLGDSDWTNDPLPQALQHYLPHVTKDSVVLELGPGTGRLTRHVLPRCAKLIAADHSKYVCVFLREYLRGKGNFRVLHIPSSRALDVASSSVDVALANGVFEHLDPEEAFCYLCGFARVLKPNGKAVFNFENIMSKGGLAWFQSQLRDPGERIVFRFYHPDTMQRLAEVAGLETIGLTTDHTRLAYITLRKPASQ